MPTLAALGSHIGMWTGTNGFRLMPSDPVSDAPATAEVALRAGGHLVAISYAWSHPTDGAQDGLLVVWASGDGAGVEALWGDSWHQSPKPTTCTGSSDGGLLVVGYEYQAGWRWNITVDVTDTEALRIQMDNVVPAEAAGEATDVVYAAMSINLLRVET